MTVFIDGPSNFHPYECSHDEYCVHCTSAKTDWHDPEKCWLCCDGDPAAEKPKQNVRPPYKERKR
jgi:hypothetical protein